jgi:Fe-S-cluster-containing hydrogenase component 2
MDRILSSLDQLHGHRASVDREGPRLRIDLDICNSDVCRKCVIDCSYFFHPVNNGVISLIELATFSLVCRKCEEPHCVKACPKEALEKLEDPAGMLVRHTVRCVSCRSCSHACPYGTIFPEILPYLTNICDYCENRGEPSCIPTCPYGALSLAAGTEEAAADSFTVGDRLVVHSTHWNRDRA